MKKEEISSVSPAIGNTNVMRRFVKGKFYNIKYSKKYPTRRWRGTNNVSEWEIKTISGEYEYCGSRGGKLHFYDNQAGIDILFTKNEAERAVNGA